MNPLHKRGIIFLFLVFFGAKTTILAQIKGMYVNDFKYIIGHPALEDELLNYASANGYNYLLFYNLYYIHNNLFDITDPVASAPLSDFLARAKNDYGILYTGAVGETFNSFGTIHDYNLDHLGTPAAQFDIYNIEFEFWNTGTTGPGGYYCTTYLEPMPCDTATAFDFLETELCRLDSLCDEYTWLNSEIYIGNPTELQCAKLAKCADRVLVHYYRSSDVYGSGNSIYNYKKYRLPPLTDSVAHIHIMPIFNCRPSYMGPWLASHPESQAYDTWQNGLNGYVDDPGSWKSKMTVDGYIWFRYTDLITAAPLAISLEQFSARKIKNHILLDWTYPFVDKLDKISIQRSSDSENWLTLKDIKHITEQTILQYKDDSPFLGENYYRLKFYFKSGEEDYSTIQSVFFERDLNQLSLYPNPAKDFIFIGYAGAMPIKQVTFFNQFGKSILTQFPEDNRVMTSALKAGIYYLEIKIGGEMFYKRCVITP